MALEHTLLLARAEIPALPPPTELVQSSAHRDTEPAKTWHAEDCGIRSNVWIHFRLDKFRTAEAEREFLALVGDVLRRDVDDALLLAHGELPVLRRVAGRVLVSTRSPWTTPEQFAPLGLRVELADLGGVV